jgi:hypothetical protein
MKFKPPKELPMDSLEQSLEMLRGIQVVNEVDTKPDLGSCEFYMNDYLDMIERDYKHGWADCMKNRSNLCTSDAYMQGYQDCRQEKQYLNKDFT